MRRWQILQCNLDRIKTTILYVTKVNKTLIGEHKMQIWNIMDVSMMLCTDIYLLWLNIAIDNKRDNIIYLCELLNRRNSVVNHCRVAFLYFAMNKPIFLVSIDKMYYLI